MVTRAREAFGAIPWLTFARSTSTRSPDSAAR